MGCTRRAICTVLNRKRLRFDWTPSFRRSPKLRLANLRNPLQTAEITYAHSSWEGRRIKRGQTLLDFKSVAVNSQFPELRFERLPGNAQLGSGAGWASDHTLGIPQRALDHFYLALDKSRNERGTRPTRLAICACKPGFIDRKGFPIAHDHRALNDVLQFANVARPVIPLEQVESIFANRSNLFTGFSCVTIDQVFHEQLNIVNALAQCRQSNWENVEPVEQILPKRAFSHGCT